MDNVIILLFKLYITMATAKSLVNVHNITIDQSGYSNLSATGLPNCGTFNKLKLLSYRYIHRIGGRESVNKTSPEAEIIIHEMCSLKQICDGLRFPVHDLPADATTVLEVKYQCLEHTETFIDICDNSEKAVDSAIHLVIRNTSLSQSLCQCRVKGRFDLNLTDVRLMSSAPRHCSDAKLQVLKNIYDCKATNENFGSVFRKNVGKNLNLAIIHYTDKSDNLKPEMVYLTISPTEGLVEVSCESESGHSKRNNVTEPVTKIRHTENDVKLKEEDSSQTTIVVVVICLCVTLVLVCLLVIRSRRKNRAKIKLMKQRQRILEDRLNIEHPAQSTVNSSAGNNAKQASSFMKEGGDYIGLQESGAATVVAGNQKHINETSCETAKSTYSYYDHLNMQTSNPNKACNGLQRKPNQGVYSYADAQPRKRETSSSGITTGHKADHQTQETAQVGKTSLSKDSSWHCDDHLSKKHTYVSLMPAQKSAARCNCEKCLTLPTPIHQKDTRVPRDDNNKKQDSRKYGVVKPSKTNNSAMTYSYATDSLGNRDESSNRNTDDAECTTSSYLDSENPVEQNLKNMEGFYAHRDTSRFQQHSQNEVSSLSENSSKSTSHETKKKKGLHFFHSHIPKDSRLGSIFNRTKMATLISEKFASRNKVGNDREAQLPKLHLETVSGEAYYDIEMDKPNIPDDNEYDMITQNPKLMRGASKYDHIRKPKAQGARSIENIDIDKSMHTAMPGRFYKNIPVQGVTDAKKEIAQEQSPFSSALLMKGNTTNLTDFSDDDHYDKVKAEFTSIQKHPNYGNLATRVRSSFLSLFQQK